MKRFFIVLLLILVVFSPSKAFAGYRADQAQKRYNYGVSHHENGNLNLAIKEYQATIEWDPSLWQAYYNLGLIYLNKEGYSGAQQMFEKVIELQPINFEAHFNLGIIYFKTGELNSSSREFNKASYLNPNNEDVHLNLASIYAKKNEEANVISELRKVYKINPYNLEVKKVLDEYDKEKLKTQQVTTQQTSLPKASASKTSTSQAPPSQVTQYDYLWLYVLVILVVAFIAVLIEFKGYIIYKIRNPVKAARKLIAEAESLKKTSKSIENLEKIQKLCEQGIKILSSRELFRTQRIESIITSNLPELKELLTRVTHLYAKTTYLLKKISIDKIQGEVEKTISLCGDRPSLLYLFGELLYLQNDIDKASKYFNRVVNLHDKGNLANLWSGILHYKLRNFKEAIVHIKSVDSPIRTDFIKEEYLLDDSKELSIEHLRYRVLSYYAIEDWNSCIECFELLVSEHVINGDLRYYMAKAYLNIHNYTKALSLINECIKDEPKDSDLLIDRAAIYKRLGKLKEAEEDLKNILPVVSNNYQIYHDLGTVCSLQNNINDALICFNKAIQLKPDCFSAHYKKGMLYEKTKLYDSAIDSYLSVLKIDERNSLPNTRIGISYCKQGKYVEALPYLQKASILGDNSSQAIYFSGLAYANIENYSKGISKWEKLSENMKAVPIAITQHIIASVDNDSRRLYSKVDTKSLKHTINPHVGVLLKDVEKLKELSVNREKYLFRELEENTKQKKWYKSYNLLNDIKKTTTDRNAVFNCLSYVRNRLFPEFLQQNKRPELSGILKSGLKENPTNYNLLHNIAVLYYWWMISAEQDNPKDIQDHKLWDNLIGYWTAIVNNDEFWEKWAKRKLWIKNEDNLDLSKIRNNLMSYLETKILSSLEKDRQQNDDVSLSEHHSNLKKLHIEKKFVMYYKELKSVLSDDVAAIPDMCSEILIHDLDMQDYIMKLSELAIQKDPYNEKINKIRYYMSPFRHVAILVEDENYEHAIKELEALPSNFKNDSIVFRLMNVSKLKLGASYLQNDNITNHIIRTEKLWSECQIMNNELANSIVESATLDAMKKFKAEGKIDVAICAGELALKFGKDYKDVKDFLSILLNDRGVSEWNSCLTKFSVSVGIYDMEKALEFNHNNVRAKKNLSIMYSLLGWQYIRQKDHYDDIKNMFDKALELDKDNEDAKKGLSIYYNNLGIAYGNALKGEAMEAINCFLWALHYDPTERTILNNLKRVSYSKYKEHVNVLKKRGITIDEEDET